jgi:ligand-binding sensor domain-containing protein
VREPMRQTQKFLMRAIAAGAGLSIALIVCFVGWRVARAVRLSTAEVHSEREIRFDTHPFAAPVGTSFELVSAPAVFLQAARFQDHLYIGGPGGLLEFDLNGNPSRQFTAGRDMPPSPLVALAPALLADSQEPELVLATAQDGLLAFNGHSFRQIRPRDSEARAITSILPASAGRLLIGTKKRGVLIYDGKQLAPLHPSLNSLYVTALAGTESDLWIGTLNQGVFHWHAGAVDSFSEGQGLADRQVQCLTTSGEKTYVGTVLGVAVFDRGRFSHVLASGVLVTSLLATDTSLIVGSEDQGVLTIPLASPQLDPHLSHSVKTAELTEVRQLFASGNAIYVLSRDALYRMSARGQGWQQVLRLGPAALSDRNISALAADNEGRLWIGYFDRGLDVLETDTGRSTHVENDHVFCVNRIVPDGRNGTVAVATANGLVRFAANGGQQQVLTRADGLIADHVTDVAIYHDGLVVGTPAGLTFLDPGGPRSMHAFHGLVNNHVYALGVSRDDLMVGTLGGLSEINKETVRVNYTAGAGFGLKHNWITAVLPVGDDWIVGTYGAGILKLDRSGRFQSFEKATGAFEVNPNAMIVTPRHVFAGSLGNGLYVYDRDAARWTVITDGLPSLNVTALAESNGTIFVGTDNGLVRILEQNVRP